MCLLPTSKECRLSTWQLRIEARKLCVGVVVNMLLPYCVWLTLQMIKILFLSPLLNVGGIRSHCVASLGIVWLSGYSSIPRVKPRLDCNCQKEGLYILSSWKTVMCILLCFSYLRFIFIFPYIFFNSVSFSELEIF